MSEDERDTWSGSAAEPASTWPIPTPGMPGLAGAGALRKRTARPSARRVARPKPSPAQPQSASVAKPKPSAPRKKTTAVPKPSAPRKKTTPMAPKKTTTRKKTTTPKKTTTRKKTTRGRR